MTKKTRTVEHNGRVIDLVKTLAPAPDWLEKSWESAKRHGLDKLNMRDIDAEISAHRHAKRKLAKSLSLG